MGLIYIRAHLLQHVGYGMINKLTSQKFSWAIKSSKNPTRRLNQGIFTLSIIASVRHDFKRSRSQCRKWNIAFTTI